MTGGFFRFITTIMPNYNYTARDNAGKIVKGALEAENEIDLANKTAAIGHFLVSWRAYAPTAKVISKLPSLKPKEVLNFTIHISTLLDSGVSLLTGLQDLAQDSENKNLSKVIDDIRSRVETGVSLREAMSAHPKSFSKLYTAIVGAGESTGKLSVCLKDLIGLLDWQLELKAKLTEATVYPVILLCAMAGVVALLVIKVIPNFEPLFAQGGIVLPLPTLIVLGVSHFARSFWYLGPLILAMLFGAYRFYYSRPKGKFMLDSLKLRLPIFGILARKVAISRFCRTFAIAVKSGVSVLPALDIAGGVLGNDCLERSARKARDSVNIGEKISVSFKAAGEFPPLVVRMISVGEQSGALPEALDKINQFYDREVPATIKVMFTFLEPVMIVFIGVVVGGIALAVLLPMFQMSQIAGG